MSTNFKDLDAINYINATSVKDFIQPWKMFLFYV